MTQLLYGSVLQQLGLGVEQAEIYELLLSTGPLSAMEIGKRSQVQRTYVYSVTQAMIEMGILTQVKQSKTTLFVAQSPDTLLSLVARQKQEAEQAERSLEGVLPLLKNIYVGTQEKPVVTYYEGPEGVMRANILILEEKKEILAYLVINKEIDQMMDKYWERYYKKRLAENIHVRAITPDSPEGKKYQERDQAELRVTRLVPQDLFPISIEKNICGNKVAYFSMKNQILVATVIENQEIADSERAMFELAWIQAKACVK